MPEHEKADEDKSTKKLLAADLWPMLTTEHGTVRLNRFQDHLTAPLDRLIESLVLYDEVAIPTQDFIIVPALINALGELGVRQLLESGALRFLRIKKMFAYTSGSGASVISITKPSGEPLPFAQDLDEVLNWIANDCTGSKDPQSFYSLLSSMTSELDAEEFTNIIRDDSEADVLESEQIREIFNLPHAHPREFLATPNKIIMYGGQNMPKENEIVQSYLQLVQSNVELAIADKLDCDDISSATGLDTILGEKFLRSGYSNAASELFDLSDIPDFSPLVRSGELPLNKLISLRNSRDGEEFRKWFHENLSNGENISKAYVDLIKKISPIDSILGKLLRVLTWTGISAGAGSLAGPVGTIAGAGVGVVGGLFDSFVMNKIQLGGSAKIFLEDFSKTTETS